MPGKDGTGPFGEGPMNGWGMGPCGRGMGRRFGRGRGFGWRCLPYERRYSGQSRLTKEDEKKFLEEELKALEEDKEAIKKRLQEI